MIPGTDQLIQQLAGSSVAAVVSVAVPVVVVAAVCVPCDAPGVGASVGVGAEVMAEAGTEQGAGEEAALSEMRFEIVLGQTAEEKSVLVGVAAAAAADEPAPGATAWTAGVDGLAGTAVDTNVLVSKEL